MPELLNVKHEAFARALVSGLRGADAVESAGYHWDKDAVGYARNMRSQYSKLRKRTDIIARFTELGTKIEEHFVVDRAGRRETLIQRGEAIYARAMQISPVMLANGLPAGVCDHCGEHTPTTFKHDPKSALKALEMLMIEEGMLVRRSEHTRREADPLEGSQGQIFARLQEMVESIGGWQLVKQPPGLRAVGAGGSPAGEVSPAGSAAS